MPPPQDRSPDQARAAIEAALGQIGYCLPGSVTVLHIRCRKPRCACTADLLRGGPMARPARRRDYAGMFALSDR